MKLIIIFNVYFCTFGIVLIFQVKCFPIPFHSSLTSPVLDLLPLRLAIKWTTEGEREADDSKAERDEENRGVHF